VVGRSSVETARLLWEPRVGLGQETGTARRPGPRTATERDAEQVAEPEDLIRLSTHLARLARTRAGPQPGPGPDGGLGLALRPDRQWNARSDGESDMGISYDRMVRLIRATCPRLKITRQAQWTRAPPRDDDTEPYISFTNVRDVRDIHLHHFGDPTINGLFTPPGPPWPAHYARNVQRRLLPRNHPSAAVEGAVIEAVRALCRLV